MSITTLQILHRIGLTDLTDEEVRLYLWLREQGKIAPNALTRSVDLAWPLRVVVKSVSEWLATAFMRTTSEATLRAHRAWQREEMARQRAELMAHLAWQRDEMARQRAEVTWQRAEMARLQAEVDELQRKIFRDRIVKIYAHGILVRRRAEQVGDEVAEGRHLLERVGRPGGDRRAELRVLLGSSEDPELREFIEKVFVSSEGPELHELLILDEFDALDMGQIDRLLDKLTERSRDLRLKRQR